MNTETQNWKKNIICFLSAQTISLFGSSLVQYAIIWYITLSTSSGKMLMLSTVCGFLPQIIVSLFAGVWIDRYHRKKIIMLADALIAFSTLLIIVLFLNNYRDMILLYVLLVIRSFATGIQTPAVNAFIPHIVPQEKLMKVNGINSTLSSFIMLLSPGISGAILSFASFETTLCIDVVTAVIGIGITFTIPVTFQKIIHPKEQTQIQQIKEGFSYLKKHTFVKKILLYQLLILFLISPSAFLTPLLVNRSFGIEVWRLSASEMTYSIGMMLGGILIASWGGFKNRLHTTMAAGAIYGCLMIGLGASPFFLLYLICNCLIGISAPCYNAPITVTLQEKVTPSMHGRVFSLMQISTSCALPIGMVLFGPLADMISIQYILIACGSLVLLVSLYLWKRNIFQDI